MPTFTEKALFAFRDIGTLVKHSSVGIMELRMGESIVGQQKEDYSDPAREKPASLLGEGAFVSPEELEGMLAALEEQDGRFLESGGSLQNEDDGVFLSPEDIGEPQSPKTIQETAVEEIPGESPSPQKENPERSRHELEDPALLSRIASELRSIKSELSHLKNSYDDVLTQTTAAVRDSNSAPGSTKIKEPQAPAISEALYQDMKKLLGYLDRLLESLPEEKIDQFARSEYFELYRKVFEYFDLV